MDHWGKKNPGQMHSLLYEHTHCRFGFVLLFLGPQYRESRLQRRDAWRRNTVKTGTVETQPWDSLGRECREKSGVKGREARRGGGGGARTEGAEAWRSAFIMHASYMAIQWQGCEHCEFFLAVNSTVPLTRSYEFGNLSILFFRRHSRLSSCFE